MSIPNRRQSETADVGPFSITVGFDAENRPFEVFVTKRAKSGTELDTLLYELGVAASKIMQRRL